MKDGFRFVDSDMHIMEPPDLFDRYLDPKFKHRVSYPIGADGRAKRGAAGMMVVDGIPISDMDVVRRITAAAAFLTGFVIGVLAPLAPPTVPLGEPAG